METLESVRAIESKLATSSNPLDIVRRALPSERYHNIALFTDEQGAQRACFTGLRGTPQSAQEVFIKINKTPGSDMAKVHAERGHNTEQEVRTLLGLPIDEALSNHISPLVDYAVDEQTETTISVEPRFRGAKSLKRKIREEGVLSTSTFEDFMSQYLQANRYLIREKGLVHRDQNPGNILLGPSLKGKGLETRLTDMTTATSLNTIDPGESTTWGARSIRHFAYASPFSHAKVSPEQAEIYSIGMNAIFALTGMFPVYYDNLHSTGVSALTHESLLNPDGSINVQKHNQALEQVFSRFPKKARKHITWIKKCVDGDVGKQYNSIDQLCEDFDKSISPTLIDRIRELPKGVKGGIALGMSALVLAAGAGVYQLDSTQQQLAEQRELAKRYRVSADWNGAPLVMENNLLELDLTARKSGDWTNAYPNIKFIQVSPGGNIDLTVRAIEKPWPKKDKSSQPPYRAITYLEGIPISADSMSRIIQNEKGVIEYYVDAESFNQGIPTDGMTFYTEFKINLPTNLNSGVHILSTALFPPEKNDYGAIKYNRAPDFASKTEAIAVKRIPIVVGKVENPRDISSLYVDGYSDYLTIRDLTPYARVYDPSKKQALEYMAFSSPEKDFIEIVAREGSGRPSMPKESAGETKYTFQMARFDPNGNVNWYSAVPIERTLYNREYSVYSTGLAAPSIDYPARLIEYRQALERSIKEFCATNRYSFNNEKTSK